MHGSGGRFPCRASNRLGLDDIHLWLAQIGRLFPHGLSLSQASLLSPWDPLVLVDFREHIGTGSTRLHAQWDPASRICQSLAGSTDAPEAASPSRHHHNTRACPRTGRGCEVCKGACWPLKGNGSTIRWTQCVFTISIQEQKDCQRLLFL